MIPTTYPKLDAALRSGANAARYARRMVGYTQRGGGDEIRSLAAAALRNFRSQRIAANIRPSVAWAYYFYGFARTPATECGQCLDPLPSNGERCPCHGTADVTGGLPDQLQDVGGYDGTHWTGPGFEVSSSLGGDPGFFIYDNTAKRILLSLLSQYGTWEGFVEDFATPVIQDAGLKFCGDCGKLLPANEEGCPFCRASAVGKCPKCETPHGPEQTYCTECSFHVA